MTRPIEGLNTFMEPSVVRLFPFHKSSTREPPYIRPTETLRGTTSLLQTFNEGNVLIEYILVRGIHIIDKNKDFLLLH